MPSQARNYALAILASTAMLGAQPKIQPRELSAKTFDAALAAILPKPEEAQWRQIRWRPDLSQARIEARREDKPILLWAMNGHPCGMT